MPDTSQATSSNDDPLAKDIIERTNGLESDAATWKTLWQTQGDYARPSKSQIIEKKTPDVTGFTQELYDHTAIRSNGTLAAGQMNYITPANEVWGRFEPPESQKDNPEAKKWFAKATEIAMKEISRSNFYLEIHECYLNRGCFGLANCFAEEGTDAIPLNFKAHDTGTYFCEENAQGLIDAFFHKFKLTARAIVKEYGIENVGKSIREAYNGNNRSKKFDLIYAIFPREDNDRVLNRMDGENMPFAAITVDVSNKKVIKNKGYLEFPGGVSRFLKWGDEVYGYAPTVEAMPIIKQINFIEKQLDALAELAAFPRVMIPDAYEGEVDLRPAGVTIVKGSDMTSGAMPKEWATQGRYDVGKDRVADKKKSIEDSFFVDLFNALAVREKTMTATEVLEIVAEKLVLFSPTFARIVTELLNPIMRRVFSILARMGKFPPVPDSVIVFDDIDGASIPDPEIVYVSKIALATKAIENRSWSQFVNIMAPVMDIDPTVVDNIDFDAVTTGVAENLGVPSDWLKSPDDVEKIRMARAAAAQAQATMEAMESGSQSAKNMADASPELANRLQSLVPAMN